MKSKSQVSMEYLVMVGFVTVITIPLILIFYDYSSESSVQINSKQVDAIGKKMVDYAESVYYLGAPSKKSLKVSFPDGIDSVSITTNELIFRMNVPGGKGDVVIYSSVPLHGSISTFEGIHNIQIEARSDGVWLTE